jgi:hypothetical protein
MCFAFVPSLGGPPVVASVVSGNPKEPRASIQAGEVVVPPRAKRRCKRLAHKVFGVTHSNPVDCIPVNGSCMALKELSEESRGSERHLDALGIAQVRSSGVPH